VIHKKYAEVAE